MLLWFLWRMLGWNGIWWFWIKICYFEVFLGIVWVLLFEGMWGELMKKMLWCMVGWYWIVFELILLGIWVVSCIV